MNGRFKKFSEQHVVKQKFSFEYYNSQVNEFLIHDYYNINHDIPVPGNWIKSGMLVEYEVIGKICSKYSSTDAYQNATTSNITCIWYEITNTCIDSNDEDTHNLKVNDCRVKSSNVNNSSTSTSTEHIETTTGITEEKKQNKLSHYLYVVITFSRFILYCMYRLCNIL
ncbi:unnamed protein product [Schistosoma guineensis]|nr:unnamed protein product [Schistosoma guineensis]